MAKRSGHADLPLHYGRVPAWLAKRMQSLGGAIVEAIVLDFGKKEVLRRLSDPFWFQSLGCVMGMDWHSSGITTSVMGALKRAINPLSHELGIYICGGRGKNSLKTPQELIEVAQRKGLDGHQLVRSSKLCAKVDNTAIQDGFQLYLHNFILTDDGSWAVVQQGLNDDTGMARRYHWHSPDMVSFVDDPHTSVTGTNQGLILNLAHSQAQPTRKSIVALVQEDHGLLLREIRKMVMPSHHDVRTKDVNIKRLGSILALVQDHGLAENFEELLLTKGLGPRTLQSMTLVSEVIYGTASRFEDPARFSFAHGGKDGHPFPVPLKVYDQTIEMLHKALHQARLGHSEKKLAFKNLHQAAKRLEQNFLPNSDLHKVIAKERRDSQNYGGRTVFGKAKSKNGAQLNLFNT